MRTPSVLDHRLRLGPFRVGEAREIGLSPRRLRASDLATPFRGVRVASLEQPTVHELCAAYARVIPRGAVFSHGTAAQLVGMPLPFRVIDDRRLHVSVPPPRRASRALGIVGHQLHLTSNEIGCSGGLPVTSAERTWCDLGALLSVRELVVAGDFLLGTGRALTTRERLAHCIAGWRGRPGVAKLRRAIALLDGRSESPQESILRVILSEAGLPRMDINVDVFDSAGAFVARPDVRFPDYRLVVEYEGDGHRTDRSQWRKDFGRTAGMQVLGEEVLRVGADDIANEKLLIRRIRTLLIQRGWSES